VKPTSSEPPGGFVNLSNHPIARWPAEQLEAARALGHGEPFDLAGGMPQVPPDADTDEVEAMADAILASLATRPCGAHVAGEPTLTTALVDRLRQAGIPCYAATTMRDATEFMRPDGSVERRATFRFVRWRRHPDLDRAGPPTWPRQTPSTTTTDAEGG